ncbi:acetylhydrolase [Bacillus sp. FJAT-27225]|uniref:alpha/beta hydrolase family protein n=1 Tax=Bacillus sp. FJAT-27225 TaxID=1743144 RepID=UPI00080C24E1|nr:dienelactone hydrolase family protein [Bacillus sp. FJAT-27225]OCA84082.1 acetylhydrolase [Bacillus sp. FJAT-27225]
MGNLLLVVVLVFEIGFAIYCMATKQTHKKLKNLVRISAFILFVILTLTPAIEWSLRWVLFAALLFAFALKATISLIRNKPTRNYKPSAIVVKSIGVVMTFVFALAPAVIFPEHRAPKITGDYEIATASYTYTDKNRIEEFSSKGENRFVNVEFWYPKQSEETYPLLVFSHGATGVKSSNTSTYKELASHGYVVVSIDHPYHSFFTRSEDGAVATIDSDYQREISNLNAEKEVYSREKLNELIQKWMKLRTDDMNFVIDTVLEKAKNDSDSVYQYINTDKIGVFGHSMGGAASVKLGRERNDIGAVVNIDAPFFSELVYKKDINDFAASDKAYTTPLLNIYSDDVWGQLDSNTLYAANKLDNQQFKKAYTTHFKGAKHLSLTDLPLFSPLLANVLQGGKAAIDQYYCIETENELILHFFDKELKGGGQFTYKEAY